MSLVEDLVVRFCLVPLLIFRSVVEILSCQSSEELEVLATYFTVTRSQFDLVETVELESGGSGRRVTMENRREFVDKLFNWMLTGIVV